MRYLSIIKRKFNTVIDNPRSLPLKLLYFLSPILGDKIYLRMLFPLKVGYKLDLKNPQTYNQKLQWLKIMYRKPELSRFVDKYEAKMFVSDIIGEQYVMKNYGLWNSFDEIDFDQLPDQFVLKTTHDQGGVVIVKDKSHFDMDQAREKLTMHLKRNQFYLSREWPYKNVRPRILAEQYMEEEHEGDLKDYKFFCFDGVVKAMFIASERQSGEEVKFNYYDADFRPLDLVQIHPKAMINFEKPVGYDTMIKLCERLSKGFPHIRIDFYNVCGRIYFGEFTFFHHGGLVPFYPPSWDYTFGSWIDLDRINTGVK